MSGEGNETKQNKTKPPNTNKQGSKLTVLEKGRNKLKSEGRIK